MAAMTYLQLCQFVHRYIRSGNAVPGSQPTAIPTPTNTQDQMVYDIIYAVPRAWEWVQNEHSSWGFMRKQGIIATTVGNRTLTLAQIQVQVPDYYGFIPFWATTNFPYFLMFDIVQQQDYIYPFIEYQEWRGFWDRNPRPANGFPNRMTEWPDKTLEFDPAPVAGPSGFPYRIKCDYRVQNQVLAAATDTPFLPAEFHDLIGWVAIKMLCETRTNNALLYQTAQQEISSYMNKLKARYLPQIQVDTTYA